MQPQLSPRYRTKGNQFAGARRDGCEYLKILYDVVGFTYVMYLSVAALVLLPATAGSSSDHVWSQLPPAPFSWPFQNSVESSWIVLLRTPNAIAPMRVASPVFRHFRWIYSYTS